MELPAPSMLARIPHKTPKTTNMSIKISFLQNCLVLINTLMIQEVLLEQTKSLLQKLAPEDFRALTPL